jgi:cytochrome c oxidase assembly factor 6
MGLFSSSSPEPKGPKISTDGTPEAPDRNERKHCWEARDAFFKCLDHNSIVDAIKDGGLAGDRCGAEGVAFEKNCASSWVSRSGPGRIILRRQRTRETFLPSISCGLDSLIGVSVQVEYFKKRRTMEHQKAKTMEELRQKGAVQMEATTSFK